MYDACCVRGWTLESVKSRLEETHAAPGGRACSAGEADARTAQRAGGSVQAG